MRCIKADVGTDAPLPCTMMSPEEWVKVFTKPDSDITFTQEEIEMIMSGTASSVFQLD